MMHVVTAPPPRFCRPGCAEHPPRYYCPVCLRTPLGFSGGPVGYREVSEAEKDRGPIIVDPSISA